MTKFLVGIGAQCNQLQKTAIEDGLIQRRNLITLITGPPGTGGTTVLTKMIEYCYKHFLPILIVSASNQGLDAVAGRFGAGQEQIDVYRLYAGLIESGDMLDHDDLAQETFIHFDSASLATIEAMFPGFSEPKIDTALIRNLADSLRSSGAKLTHMALSKHIMERCKAANSWEGFQDKREQELVMGLMRWQYYISEAKISNLEISDEELQDGLRKAWEHLQRYYLSQAQGSVFHSKHRVPASPERLSAYVLDC